MDGAVARAHLGWASSAGNLEGALQIVSFFNLSVWSPDKQISGCVTPTLSFSYLGEGLDLAFSAPHWALPWWRTLLELNSIPRC